MSAKKHALSSVTKPPHYRTRIRLSQLLKMAAMPLLFLFLTVATRGQSALDGFDPNANGNIFVVVVQPDGKILLGGNFTTLSPNGGAPVTRNHIARLNSDGTLDTLFNPNANELVRSIAVQTDGKVLAGGLFTNIGGQPRNRIARLDATTGAADSFDPNANDIVSVIALQPDGKILAGGVFTSIGGQMRSRIARLDANTGLADSFNPNAIEGTVSSLAVQTNGKILVGGSFSAIGGQSRFCMARLDATTGLADSFAPNANGYVAAIVVQPDGKILVGGQFFIVGGQTRTYIARLDPITGSADSFNPAPSFVVNALALQADGKILAGGYFTFIGSQPRNHIARLDATTGLPDSFDANSGDIVHAIAVQPDGKVLAGGEFTTLAPNGGPTVTRNRIARLEIDGRVDQTLNPGTVGIYVAATAVQPDGKTLIGGGFSSVLGVARNNIARLNGDGTLDMAFNPNADGVVYAIAVQPDGRILAGGLFVSIGGQSRNRIARLDAISGLADSFDPNANSVVNAIALQADGKILVGGDFSAPNGIGGQPRNRIARLDPITGLADSFNPNASSDVRSIVVQADGKILVGGDFGSIGGQPRNRIARLDAISGLADSFDPNANNVVNAIAVQADGKVLVGGFFSSIGGQARNSIARLNATTGLADSFDPNGGTVLAIAVQADGKILVGGGFSGPNTIGGQIRNGIARLDATTGLADSFNPNAHGIVYAIALLADGKILAGGTFDSIGGQPRSLFARLSNDTAALRNLSVTQTAIAWTLAGSSPQFTRVTFDSSTDNVNYTALGNGTAAGSTWILTGLSLPTAQNFYIRARGYYRSGRNNASESIAESVRNAFFVRPAITSANNTTFAVGTAGTFTVTTTGIPTGVSMSITESGALPAGVTFVNNNNGTATLAGTPDAGTGGIYPITITANNGVSPNASQDFLLTVNQPPGITSANNATFTTGVPGTFSIITTGFPAGGSMTITESGALPTGVTFTNNNNGTATLSGTPGAGTAGTYPLIITASNGIPPNANQNFTLTAIAPSPTPTPTPGFTPGTLGNISTRLRVLSGDNALIGGMIATGTAGKRVIIRAIGPSLIPFGVLGALANPTLDLFQGSTPLSSNDDWSNSPQQPEIAASGLAPSSNLESAIIWTLVPGQTYTAVVRGLNGTTGIGVVDAFDLDPAAASKLGNISTRGFVDVDDNVMIAGLIAGPGNGASLKILVRALGPTLSDFGVAGALTNPTLDLVNASGTVIRSNDNWKDDPQQRAAIEAAGLAPSHDEEAALVEIVAPGAYTAVVRGSGRATGVGLVEAYNIP